MPRQRSQFPGLEDTMEGLLPPEMGGTKQRQPQPQQQGQVPPPPVPPGQPSAFPPLPSISPQQLAQPGGVQGGGQPDIQQILMMLQKMMQGGQGGY